MSQINNIETAPTHNGYPTGADVDRLGRRDEKKRYLTLDAMRGVAAIAVYFHHAPALSAPLMMPAGYRAVDLFFVLSGFVIAHAYSHRLATTLSAKDFFIIRVIRLYPLYLLGAVIGIGGAGIALILGGGDISPEDFAIYSLFLVFMLPTPLSGALFPLNLPSWSLFFELIANVFYGMAFKFLKPGFMALIITLSLAFLVFLSIGHGNTNFGLGWSTLGGGIARTSFSFFVGILIQKYMIFRQSISKIYWLLILLVIPPLYFYPENIFFDLFCITTLFPLMIIAGTRLEISSSLLAHILSSSSYGLYIVHVPVILLVYKISSYLGKDPAIYSPWLGLCILLATVVGLSTVINWYDLAFRNFLTRLVK